MKLDSGGGGKHIATTARKEKPDGTREVSHKVEHHYDTMNHMRSARQYKTQKGVPLAKPLKPRDSSGIHHAIAGHGLGPHDRAGTMESTIRALRDSVLQNAMAGEGRLERPAPILSGEWTDPGATANAGDLPAGIDILTALRRRHGGLGADPWRGYMGIGSQA